MEPRRRLEDMASKARMTDSEQIEIMKRDLLKFYEDFPESEVIENLRRLVEVDGVELVPKEFKDIAYSFNMALTPAIQYRYFRPEQEGEPTATEDIFIVDSAKKSVEDEGRERLGTVEKIETPMQRAAREKWEMVEKKENERRGKWQDEPETQEVEDSEKWEEAIEVEPSDRITKKHKTMRNKNEGLTEIESINFGLFIGRYQVKDGKIIDSDIVIEKQPQAKGLVKRWNTFRSAFSSKDEDEPTEIEDMNFGLFIGRYQVRDGKIVDSDIVLEKQPQAKELVKRWKAHKKMRERYQKLRQDFDRYEWWPRHSKDDLEWLIKDKQDEVARLRTKDDEQYTSIRVPGLEWDIENIQYVLGVGKQSSIPMDTEFGIFAQRSKEHWEKMYEYSKETEKMSEEFERGLPSWLGGEDKSWLCQIKK